MHLEKFWFFDSLSPKELEELKQITHKKSFTKGEILFYLGDTPKYLHLLVSGVVKLYKHDIRENEVVLHNLTAPNLIAEIVNFEELSFPANCAFESDGEVYLIEYEAFKDDVIEIDLTPNRGDCLSIYGVARDLSAAFNRELKNAEPADYKESIGIGKILSFVYE